MKVSLTRIIRNVIVGKKIAKQEAIHDRYWGKTITNVVPSNLPVKNKSGYNIVTDDVSIGSFYIEKDYKLELE